MTGGDVEEGKQVVTVRDIVVRVWKWTEYPSVEAAGTYIRGGRTFGWRGTCRVNGNWIPLNTVQLEPTDGGEGIRLTEEEKRLFADTIVAAVNARAWA